MLAAFAECDQQQGRGGRVALDRLPRGHHHRQRDGGQQHQRGDVAQHRHAGQQRHGHKREEEQRCQGQRLAPEGLDAQLDPGESGLGRNDVEFHGMGGGGFWRARAAQRTPGREFTPGACARSGRRAMGGAPRTHPGGSPANSGLAKLPAPAGAAPQACTGLAMRPCSTRSNAWGRAA